MIPNDDTARLRELLRALGDHGIAEHWPDSMKIGLRFYEEDDDGSSTGVIAQGLITVGTVRAVRQAADRIEALEAGLRKVDSAWDALPGDKFHSPKVVESWLSVHMAPAIRAARDLVKGNGE